MSLFDSLIQSLLSPMVLAFLLGIIASLIKSDLKFPPELYSALTIYLLFAIGLKGGAKLVGLSFSDIWLPMTVAIVLSVAIPLWCFAILRRLGKFDGVNSAALSAHYGSVSAVTFAEGVAFLDLLKVSSEPYMPAMLTVMEVPAILVAILLVGRTVVSSGGGSWGKVMHELISGKGVVLLIGGMAIGLLGGEKGYAQVAPLFDTPFRGVLTLFLLEIGLITGRSLGDVRKAGKFLIGFALIMPMLHGIIGALLGYAMGMSVGGTTLLATLAASASYIAAPAAVRVALPQANPALYFTASLALTFPFNVVIGIPTYYALAEWLHRQ